MYGSWDIREGRLSPTCADLLKRIGLWTQYFSDVSKRLLAWSLVMETTAIFCWKNLFIYWSTRIFLFTEIYHKNFLEVSFAKMYFSWKVRKLLRVQQTYLSVRICIHLFTHRLSFSYLVSILTDFFFFCFCYRNSKIP